MVHFSLALELLKVPPSEKLQLQHDLKAAKPNHTFLIELAELNFDPESISSLIDQIPQLSVTQTEPYLKSKREHVCTEK